MDLICPQRSSPPSIIPQLLLLLCYAVMQLRYKLSKAFWPVRFIHDPAIQAVAADRDSSYICRNCHTMLSQLGFGLG